MRLRRVDPAGTARFRDQIHPDAICIVLKGTANTIIGGVRRVVNVGGSFQVSSVAMYQVANVGKTPREILEARIDATPVEEVIKSRQESTELEKEQAGYGDDMPGCSIEKTQQGQAVATASTQPSSRRRIFISIPSVRATPSPHD